ncbi:MAG: CapA family protein, partial [Actinobacteria bacterium]|nr:CapA family protein [Actinomycetota bacterium]
GASRTWYFAEGTTRSGFNEWVCLLNPNVGATVASVTYMLEGKPPVVKSYYLPARSRTTVDVASEIEAGNDVSVEVMSQDPVVAERPMYFRYKGVWTGGHDIVGANAPQREWYFAEGTCRPDFEPYICIQNPGVVAAKVKITYMLGDGTTEEESLTVPEGSRKTVVVKQTLGEGDDPAHDFSAKVETTNETAIVAERPMYFNYKGKWSGGHDVIGALAPDSAYYFAEGTCRPDFEPYICIQNPGGAAAEVKITYMLGDGTTRVQQLSVPGNSRKTVVVKDFLGEGDDPAHDFSAKVETTNETTIIAERPMYFNYTGVWPGGHDVVGALAPGDTYYFAEGTCRPGFDPYLCIQNPGGAAAEVTITYILGDGTNEDQEITVPANSRETIPVKHVLGEGDDAAHDFSAKVETTNGTGIVVERPMYFSYASTARWTLSAVGDVNLGGDMSLTLATQGFDYPWTLVGDMLRGTTLTFANLECTMSSSGEPVPGKTFTFRGDPAALPYMRDAGVDVVSQANNHARDYGATSLVDALGYLDDYGIAHCGAGADYEGAHVPAYLDANGLRIAFLAYDEIGYLGWYAEPGYPGVADATDTGKLAADIKAAKQDADLVVVSFHWGTEKKYTPDSDQTSFAHLAVDCGADLVLGHHPHVVQGFEFYNEKLIANSLGNFVFNPGSEECRYTILTQFSLDASGLISTTVYPVYITNGRPQLMEGEEGNAWINQVASMSQALGTPMAVTDGVGHIP